MLLPLRSQTNSTALAVGAAAQLSTSGCPSPRFRLARKVLKPSLRSNSTWQLLTSIADTPHSLQLYSPSSPARTRLISSVVSLFVVTVLRRGSARASPFLSHCTDGIGRPENVDLRRRDPSRLTVAFVGRCVRNLGRWLAVELGSR